MRARPRPNPRNRRHHAVSTLVGLVLGTASGPIVPVASAQADAPKAAEGRTVPEGLRFANALLRDRRYDLAADQYQKFLGSSPSGSDAAEARFGLGRSKLFLSDYPAARREFEAYLKLAPEGPNAATAAFRAGESAFLMGDFAAARTALDSYLSRYPDHVHRDSAWPLLGDSCVKLGDLPAAKEAYMKALETGPKGRLANRTRYYLGRTLGSLGQAEEAVKLLAILASADDAEWSGKARLLSGQILLSAGKAAEAAEAFAEIERTKPPGVAPAEARLRRAEALIAANRRDEAEALLAPMAAEGSRSVAPPAAFSLGGSKVDRGRWSEAVSICDDAIRRVPDSPWAPRLLFRSAEALARDGKLAEARARFLKVADDYPKDSWAMPARLRAARAALEAKDFASAETIASELPAKLPSDALRAEARLIAARAALGRDRPKDAIAALEALIAGDRPTAEVAQSASYYLGLAYKADGQADRAAKLLDDLARSGDAPASADARLAIGFHHFEARRFDEAAKAFQGYLDARPKGEDAPQALAYLALSRTELKQADAARAALDRLAAEWPGSDALTRSRVILAESALDSGRFDDASALFRLVADAGESKWKARALSGLGWSLLQANHPEEAASAFAALLAHSPQDPLAADAALGRGQALEACKKDEEALEAFASVATSYPRTPQAGSARVAHARLLSRTGKAAEASEEFRGLIAAPPKDVTADDLMVEWGWALHDAGRAAEADAAFRRLLDERPDGPRAADARVFLAESTHASGKADEAATLLEPVVAEGSKAEPTLVQTALLRLGRIDLARGDAAKAASRFDRLVRDYPDGKFLIEARFGKAEADLKRGHPEAAGVEFAAIAKEAGPDSSKWASLARLRRVQCLAALDRWDDVLSTADAIRADKVVLTPSQGAELDYCRGRALQSQARFDEARAALQSAIDAAPGTEVAARSQFMRGESFFHQKNHVEALREFHKTDLSYAFPEWQAAALLEAGKVYEQLSRWTDAVDVYEKILAKFPMDARIADVKSRLEAAKAKP